MLFSGHLPAGRHPYFAEIKGMRVSAHALVRRDGEIVQFVPFHERAWHAGVSQYEGRAACNDFSVGIEFEGEDETAYTEPQYHAGAALIGALLVAYSTLDASRIVGHSDIAPGRKTDPGTGFDWQRLRAQLARR